MPDKTNTVYASIASTFLHLVQQSVPPCNVSVTSDVNTIIIAAKPLVFLSPAPEVHVY